MSFLDALRRKPPEIRVLDLIRVVVVSTFL